MIKVHGSSFMGFPFFLLVGVYEVFFFFSFLYFFFFFFFNVAIL